MKKFRKILTIIFSITVVLICGIFLNKYLSNHNYLFYATGTSDKAFLNSTWKMSPQEIERANDTSLKPGLPPLFTPEIAEIERFKTLSQINLHLFGYPAKVAYTFFDNMLYEYYIILHTSDLEKPHKEILATLTKQFGETKKIDKKRSDIIFSFLWDTEKQSISYWLGKSEGTEKYFTVIRAIYKPYYKQIKEFAKNEKERYF
ncbi:hypothetical protein ACFL2O_11395 [Thermodesulfobacteriota bacterium]